MNKKSTKKNNNQQQEIKNRMPKIQKKNKTSRMVARQELKNYIAV